MHQGVLCGSTALCPCLNRFQNNNLKSDIQLSIVKHQSGPECFLAHVTLEYFSLHRAHSSKSQLNSQDRAQGVMGRRRGGAEARG